MRSIFISYRIEDSNDQVGRLEVDLGRAFGTAAVFRDKSRLRGGDRWTQELELEAKSCSVMLVVIGNKWQSASFQAGDRKGFPRLSDAEDWVRREITIGLNAGNRVIPIYLNGAEPPEKGWLKVCGLEPLFGIQGVRLRTDDYQQDFARLLDLLKDYVPLQSSGNASVSDRRKDFYRHVPLPANYVFRERLQDTLRSLLLSGTKTVALTHSPVQRPSALHGMGGIGKTVLARAACEDPLIQATFADGILWTSLGQTPNLKHCLREWLGALDVTVTANAPTVNMLADELANALQSRACLLVVDDVWDGAHLMPFISVGPRCRLVITTRNAAIARHFGAKIFPVELMNEKDAIALLDAWADDGLAAVDHDTKRQIVERVGRLPLAVKLVGAQLQRGSVEEWMRDYDGIRALQSNWNPEEREGSVEACFRLSVKVLSEAMKRLYFALGIFPEDEPIPVNTVAKLWCEWAGGTVAETSRLLHSLADRALLQLVTIKSGEAITLHDLLREMVNEHLSDQRVTMHTKLLSAYAKARRDDCWATVIDDGYFSDHLIYHLTAIGAADDIAKLFSDDRWMISRFSQSGDRPDGYLNDLDVFWRSATENALAQIAQSGDVDAVVDCIRCALIQTSINSTANTNAPRLLVRAVELNVWTFGRALSTLDRVPDLQRRLDGFLALLEQQTLEPANRMLLSRRGMDIAFRLSEGARTSYRGRLAAVAAVEVLPELVESVLSSTDCMYVPNALASFFPRVKEVHWWTRFLDHARSLPAVYVAHTPRHLLLQHLAIHLPEELVDHAVNLAEKTTSKNRSSCIAAYIPRVAEKRKVDLLDLCWRDAVAMPPATSRSRTHIENNVRASDLASIAPCLTPQKLREANVIALTDLQSVSCPYDKVQIIKAFASFFDSDSLASLTNTVHNLPISGEFGSQPWLEAVGALTPLFLSVGYDDILSQAVELVFTSKRGMKEIAAALPVVWRDRSLERLLMEGPQKHSQSVVALLPYLSSSQKASILNGDGLDAYLDHEDWDLSSTVTDLPAAAFDQLAEAVQAYPDRGGKSSSDRGFYSEKDKKVEQVASRLSASQVKSFLKSRSRTRDEYSFVKFTVNTFQELPQEQRDQAIRVALNLALQLPDEDSCTPPTRERCLEALVPHLAPEQVCECHKTVAGVSIPLTRVFGLSTLMPYLQTPNKDEAIKLSVETIESMKHDEHHEFTYGIAMASLLAHSSERETGLHVGDAVSALHLGYVGHEEALELLVPLLDNPCLDSVMRWILRSGRLEVLPNLVRRIAENVSDHEILALDECLEAGAVENPAISKQSHLLARLILAKRLPPARAASIVELVLEEISQVEGFYLFHFEVYRDIVSLLPLSAVCKAFEAAKAYETSRRVGALRALYPRLDAEMQSQALELVVSDMLAKEGFDALFMMENAFEIVRLIPDHRALVLREFVTRLYAERDAERERVLAVMTCKGLMSEVMASVREPASIVTSVIAIYDKWRWA